MGGCAQHPLMVVWVDLVNPRCPGKPGEKVALAANTIEIVEVNELLIHLGAT